MRPKALSHIITERPNTYYYLDRTLPTRMTAAKRHHSAHPDSDHLELQPSASREADDGSVQDQDHGADEDPQRDWSPDPAQPCTDSSASPSW